MQGVFNLNKNNNYWDLNLPKLCIDPFSKMRPKILS